MTSRRAALIAIVASTLAAAFPSLAQQPAKLWRVGVLAQTARPDPADPGASTLTTALVEALRDLGYVEGKNLAYEWRYAGNKLESLPGLARELVQLKVDVIVTGGIPSTHAAKDATATIPIVMSNVTDPVAEGFVKSLGRPGGNVTGFATLAGEAAIKHLDILRQVLPRLSRVAFLVNPSNPGSKRVLESLRVAARAAKISVVPVEASTRDQMDRGVGGLSKDRVGALIVSTDPTFAANVRRIAGLAAGRGLPSIAPFLTYAEAGGLMSYGTDGAENFRRTAAFLDRLFKGAKPAELPVEQPTKIALHVNRSTAKAIGVTIPQSVLLRADRVIE